MEGRPLGARERRALQQRAGCAVCHALGGGVGVGDLDDDADDDNCLLRQPTALLCHPFLLPCRHNTVFDAKRLIGMRYSGRGTVHNGHSLLGSTQLWPSSNCYPSGTARYTHTCMPGRLADRPAKSDCEHFPFHGCMANQAPFARHSLRYLLRSISPPPMQTCRPDRQVGLRALPLQGRVRRW